MLNNSEAPDYRELSDLSTGYARLRGKFLCITTSFAMVAPRYARYDATLIHECTRMTQMEYVIVCIRVIRF